MKDEEYTQSDIQKVFRAILRNLDNIELFDVDLLKQVSSLAIKEFIKIHESKETFVKYDEEIVNDFFERYNLDKSKYENITDLLNVLMEIDSICFNMYADSSGYYETLVEMEEEKYKSPRPKRPKKPFKDWLTPKIPEDRRALFAEKLKAEFRNEKGLGIRFFIEAMTMEGMEYIIIPERQNKYFYESLKDYFNWYIGTYNGIFNPVLNFNKKSDKYRLMQAKKRIEALLK